MVKGFDHSTKQETILCTPAVKQRQEAIEEKLRLLQGRILGRSIVQFDIGMIRDVWVPYSYFVYQFEAERKILFRKKGMEKRGETGIIFDRNEAHPFQYDLYEEGGPALIRKKDEDARIRIEPQVSPGEAKKLAETYIQDRIMKRFYGATGILTLQEKQDFFRPAVEIEVIYRKKNVNKRYAYLDDFGIQSEHILGLKYRVENHF